MLIVRPLILHEKKQLLTRLAAENPFTRRHCQILLASAKGERAASIHARLDCTLDVIREAIRSNDNTQYFADSACAFWQTKQRWTL